MLMTGTAALLKTHVYTLAAEIGERNVFRPDRLRAAADYIRRTWIEQGYEVVSQCCEANSVASENLEISRWGAVRKDQIVLLGAHYDSIRGSPGADDNASGVAALLEISRRLATVQTDRTVRFVAFVNEEPPFFFWKNMGSMLYAGAARRRGDDIRLMISLEMLGYYDERPGSQHYPPLFRFFYPNRANFIAFVSNLGSRSWMRRAVSAFAAHSDFPVEHVATLGIIPGISLSDHLSFWRHGYRALMVTDTAFYRNPCYHSPWDVADSLDYVAFARVTDGLFESAIQLADSRVQL
jgi:Zn-dependent M28 family amino/carboxypeptidase